MHIGIATTTSRMIAHTNPCDLCAATSAPSRSLEWLRVGKSSIMMSFQVLHRLSMECS